eukprot:758888-Hanusia_phi.AAC.3
MSVRHRSKYCTSSHKPKEQPQLPHPPLVRVGPLPENEADNLLVLARDDRLRLAPKSRITLCLLLFFLLLT